MSHIHAKRPKKQYCSSAHNGCTLNEVVEMLNLTHERVRQIEVKALLKLRKHMQSNNIYPKDLLD